MFLCKIFSVILDGQISSNAVKGYDAQLKNYSSPDAKKHGIIIMFTYRLSEVTEGNSVIVVAIIRIRSTFSNVKRCHF